MKQHKEQLWQAHLDGELSAKEAAEFERSLSDEDRALLCAEMRLERGIAEKICEGVSCPDDVWERTKALVADAAEQSNVVEFAAPKRSRWYWGMATLAAAASIAFVISSMLAPVSPSSSSIVMAAGSVSELAARSETDASMEAAEAYLRAHSIALDVADIDHSSFSYSGHELHVLGAAHEQADGEQVAEMLFDCCGRPVKVLLAERGSAAAMLIGNALGHENDIQATRAVGNYLIALVGEHRSEDILGMFDAGASEMLGD